MVNMPAEIMLGAVIIVILLIILFVVIVMRSLSRQSAAVRQLQTDWGSNKLPIDWDAINDDLLQAEIAKGNKIGAIKRYRQLTNLGLKEAKDAIDYAMLHPDERGDKKKKATYDAQDAGIRDLIQDGRMNEAIEIYQKFAGVDAYTARDAVEAIANDLRMSDN